MTLLYRFESWMVKYFFASGEMNIYFSGISLAFCDRSCFDFNFKFNNFCVICVVNIPTSVTPRLWNNLPAHFAQIASFKQHCGEYSWTVLPTTVSMFDRSVDICLPLTIMFLYRKYCLYLFVIVTGIVDCVPQSEFGFESMWDDCNNANTILAM